MYKCPICEDYFEEGWALEECSECGRFVCFLCIKQYEDEMVCDECAQKEGMI